MQSAISSRLAGCTFDVRGAGGIQEGKKAEGVSRMFLIDA